MRKILLSMVLICLCIVQVDAQAKKTKGKDGFRLKVKFTDVTDSSVFLVHYYGLPLPKIYRTDSVKLDSKGEAVFKSDSFILGGIYMVLLADKSSYFELLLNNGDDFSITATKKRLAYRFAV